MKFSYVMLPDYPLEDSMRAIRLADELGFYACYAADETWHKDSVAALRGRGEGHDQHPLRTKRVWRGAA